MVVPPPSPWSAGELTFLWRLLLAVGAWWITTLTRKPAQRRRWYRDWLLGLSLVLSFFIWPWLRA